MYIFETNLFGVHIAPTWYGLMYALAFLVGYVFLKKCEKMNPKQLDSLFLFLFLGVILGGRIGYIVFYDLGYFLSHPVEILQVWKGGMSFHGGFIGVILATFLFVKKYNLSFWYLIDRLAVITPVGLGLGRIGNWMNQELPGYSPYAGPFPMNIGGTLHFPSPLFEMMLEGVVLGIIMLAAYRMTLFKNTPGKLSAVFLIGYSIARLLAEQFRLPDVHVGYLFGTGWLTLGMIYTVPMLFLGVYLFYRSRKD